MMKYILITFLTILSLNTFAKKNTTVVMETSMGEVEIKLFDESAPITVKNFLKYVDEKFYDGTIFHRVIDNFMVQGGGFDINLKQKKTHAPIKNEATNRISNTTGTVAMARTNVVDSATAQFFINVNDNTFLNHRGTGASEYGYAVFGNVVKGMSVINKMKKAQTTRKGYMSDVPMENIIIKKMYRKK
ncbi:peptidylprolyl isomerase [Halobacteriovorax marinus]|uniref:peptidylprolyl isomerase n=1 Tax=Halobacteriovorax marinus TaxID=97084 RepID=UPI003A9567D7